MREIQGVIEDFITKGLPFTSIDISNTIKQTGKWVRNRYVAKYLRKKIANHHNYIILPITVSTASGTGSTANLYYPNTFDPMDYHNRNQRALTPQDVDDIIAKLKGYENKDVADSIANIPKGRLTKTILDRSKNIDLVINSIIGLWRTTVRERSTRYTDLATLLFALAEGECVVNIPEYDRIVTKSETTDTIISTTNRHGKLLSIGSNKKFFSFYITMIDVNVISDDKIGAYRRFSLTDYAGNWRPGFSELQIIKPTGDWDNQLQDLFNSGLKTFKYFVRPQRSQSLFGRSYILTKALIARIQDEIKYINGAIDKTITPKDDTIVDTVLKEETDSLSAEYFTVDLLMPDFIGSYPKVDDQKHLRKYLQYLQYNALPFLQFITRTVEFAYSKYGKGHIPEWVKGTEWSQDSKSTTKSVEISDDLSLHIKTGVNIIQVPKSYTTNEVVEAITLRVKR